MTVKDATVAMLCAIAAGLTWIACAWLVMP
jgi:hypothetical protein